MLTFEGRQDLFVQETGVLAILLECHLLIVCLSIVCFIFAHNLFVLFDKILWQKVPQGLLHEFRVGCIIVVQDEWTKICVVFNLLIELSPEI